jgi:chromosome segregation ATPase
METNMTQTLDQRLDAALTRRTDALATQQRIEGKLEAAKKGLETVESECRDKGVEPESLDKTIEQLEERYSTSVEQLEQQVEVADAALAPFLQES